MSRALARQVRAGAVARALTRQRVRGRLHLRVRWADAQDASVDQVENLRVAGYVEFPRKQLGGPMQAIDIALQHGGGSVGIGVVPVNETKVVTHDARGERRVCDDILEKELVGDERVLEEAEKGWMLV